MLLDDIILNALNEDIGEADHTTRACIPASATGKAQLIIKEEGILAGVEVALAVFAKVDAHLAITTHLHDGDAVKKGDIAFVVEGSLASIVTAERTVLNIMQRMSGIATSTHTYVKLLEGTRAVLLDTRKTTPGVRLLEKMAVRIGGAENHRFGLYDMILIKDNHIDAAGGIKQALSTTETYLKQQNKPLKIEIEVRSFDELNEVLAIGKIHRILLDNFTPADMKKAVEMVNGKFETEASGMINHTTLREYALTGVDYISCGALTHQIKSLDMSLKIVK